MTSRFRLRPALKAGFFSLALAASLGISGCGDAFNAGPLSYVETDRIGTELKGKPQLQEAVRKATLDLFGPDPQHIKVPQGSGLPSGGVRLANYRDEGDGQPKPIFFSRTGSREDAERQTGGYSVYRRQCLHCHGVSGAGDGPTAPFLYPRPRDYRKGLFKFTSTPTGVKPSREDLRKTIKHGLHGTSMPAFESLLSEPELEQVLDYVIFLSMRGETELALVDEAAATEELPPDVVADVANSIFNKWRVADSQAVNPPVPRTPSSRESILRGKELFLGMNKTGNKVDCTSCHGPQAIGNGPSFVGEDVFFDVVFGGDPSLMNERLAKYDDKTKELWKNSLDDWGNPLRPGNLNRGDRTVYKGGRRPIDLYWRISKGINGAKMPAHFPTIEPERIWDLVNFVFALPEEPSLLDGATLPAAPPAALPAPAVAGR